MGNKTFYGDGLTKNIIETTGVNREQKEQSWVNHKNCYLILTVVLKLLSPVNTEIIKTQEILWDSATPCQQWRFRIMLIFACHAIFSRGTRDEFKECLWAVACFWRTTFRSETVAINVYQDRHYDRRMNNIESKLLGSVE